MLPEPLTTDCRRAYRRPADPFANLTAGELLRQAGHVSPQDPPAALAALVAALADRLEEATDDLVTLANRPELAETLREDPAAPMPRQS